MSHTAVHEKPIQNKVMQSGISTARMIYIAAFLGGPLAGGYLLSNNDRVLGYHDKAKWKIIYSILGTIVLFAILFYLPDSFFKHIPKHIIPIIYSALYVAYFQAKQKGPVGDLLKKGINKYSYWKVFGVIIVSLIASFLIVMSLVVVKEGGFKSNEIKQFNLGIKYAKGIGVKKNLKTAAMHFKKSANGGLAQAEDVLGDLYYSGQGVPENKLLAVKWFKKAAEQNNPHAEMILGAIYLDGIPGIKPNLQIGKQYLEKASHHGNKHAKKLLSELNALNAQKNLLEHISQQ